jgi:hypothetical protein
MLDPATQQMLGLLALNFAAPMWKSMDQRNLSKKGIQVNGKIIIASKFKQALRKAPFLQGILY